MCVYKIAVMVIVNTQFSLVNFMEENSIETGIFVNTRSDSEWLYTRCYFGRQHFSLIPTDPVTVSGTPVVVIEMSKTCRGM